MYREEAYSLFECSFNDGRREQLAFPKHLIPAGQTEGKAEIVGFLGRLGAARDAIDRCPEFKASFGEHFHPLVLKVACQYVTIGAARSLGRRLKATDAQVLQQIERSSNKYPYARVKRNPRGRPRIELVTEALSVPRMVSAVERIIGAGLELISSRQFATSWGMNHILAWTLETFARSEDLRRSVAELEPAEADQLIWSRAWGGEDFHARFAQAVHILASELATFVLEGLDVGNHQIEWTEALLGLRSSFYYLEIASEAKRSGDPVLNWVTTTYAGLPASATLAVAEILRENGWRQFADERDRRRFVFKEARRKNQEFDLLVLGCAGLTGLQHYRLDLWERCGFDAVALGRDSIVFTPLDSATPLIDTSGISAKETLLLIEKAISTSHLSFDAQRVMYARMQGYTRDEAYIPFRMSKRQGEAAWRELNRKKEIFLSILSPKSRPNCRLQ